MSASERTARIALDLACAILALTLAMLIYAGWREGLWIHVPLAAIDGPLTRFARVHPLPDWIRFSLPDALWQYAFVATMLAVWRGERWHPMKLAFVSAPIALGMLAELGQAAGVVPGTFDPLDLAASALAALVALAFHGARTGAAPSPRVALQ